MNTKLRYKESSTLQIDRNSLPVNIIERTLEIRPGLEKYYFREVGEINLSILGSFMFSRQMQFQDSVRNTETFTAPIEQRRIEKALRMLISRENESNFVDRALDLERLGKNEESLDLVYEAVDELLRKGEFSELNSILWTLNVEVLPLRILLGVLIATFPAASKLPERQNLLAAARSFLSEQRSDVDELLAGLDP